MSASTSSGVQRHRQHAYDVGTNKHNQYGLSYGYAVNPDPNDPYGWQAYEAERAKKKKHLAEMRAAAEAASQLHMQQMAANVAPAGHAHSSNSSSSSSSSASSDSASCPSSSSFPRSSCSGSTSSTSPAVRELKTKEKKERQQARADVKKQQEEKETRKKEKCCGAACLMKTLGTRRSKPHWCDGKKWGGKIWGLARDPGDKNPDNWGVYFHPKLSRSEVVKICHRRCPPPKKRHKKAATKMVVAGCCHGPSCPQGQPVVPLPVPVPVSGEFADDYSGDVCPTAGYSGMPVDMGPGPSIPLHAGYTGHPAGNVERWRVHTADKENSKSGSKKGSDKGSKKGSKSGSEKSSKANYSFFAAAPTPENKGFDNRFLYAGTEYGNDGGVGGGVRAGGNYARAEPVPIPGASFLKSISPHISDEAGPASSPAPETAAEDGQDEAPDSPSRSSKGKTTSKLPIPSCWVESASSSTTSFEAAGPASRQGRFRSRRDDAGRVREGSWERVSPEVQRERECQRLQDEERGRLQREADTEADATAVADAEQWYKTDPKVAASSSSSRSTARSGYSYPDFQVNTANIANTAAPASHSSGSAPSDYLTMVDSSYFAHHMGSPAKYQTASVPAPGSVSTSESASSLSTAKTGIASPHSASGDTGYETGHDAESEAHKLLSGTYIHDDPGHGSMHGSVYGGYGAYGDYSGYGTGHVWGELDALATTLLSSSARESTEEGTSKKSDGNGKSKTKTGKKEKKGKKGKKGKSETSSSSSVGSGSRDSHRHKKLKNNGGLLAKIVGW